jgi:hypothetical protein
MRPVRTVRVRLRRIPAWLPRLFAAIVLWPCLAAAAPPDGQMRREARGWLQLERDQQTYRQRAQPPNLVEERELRSIERSQDIELRSLQRRQRARDDLDARRQRQERQTLGRDTAPRRDPVPDYRRALERQRLKLRTQQQNLPFDRR